MVAAKVYAFAQPFCPLKKRPNMADPHFVRFLAP
jgi:hypothetical protein